MSGICGIIQFEDEPVDAAAVRRMAEVGAHRGPDGIHHRISGGVGFAHLAHHVTPESFREEQPLVSPRDNLILTADARVDNRDDLISILTPTGHLAGADPTDADLILAAYRRWGADCPARIVGDFAFAIWDGTRRRLFAARDAMAMRAFYYRVEARRLLFATEVKQILAAPNVPVRIFEPAVAAHLSGPFGKPEWTFYEGIAQLAPAHALVADANGNRIWRYWDVEPEFRIKYADDAQYAEHLLQLFEEAVQCRLRAARPLGISLSGGLDSGSIASVAGRLLQNHRVGCPAFRAYCYAFKSLPQCDERHISDEIVKHYGLPCRNVPADEAWPLKGYPAHGPDQDEPFVGVYQALMDATIETARKDQVAVLFSGERGDELMGSWVYDEPGLLMAGQWRLFWEELQAHRRLPGMTMRRTIENGLLRPFLELLPPRVGTHSWEGTLRRTLSPAAPFSLYPPWIRRDFLKKVGMPEVLQSSNASPGLRGFARRQRYRIIFSPISGRRVVWLERSQARFGVGFADPWSDRRIASFVLAAPQWVVSRAGQTKRLIRLALQGVMPEQIRSAAGKTEPGALFDRGLKDQAKDCVLRLITNSVAGDLGYVEEDALRNSYESYLHGEPQAHDFWWALSLEMWLRRYWVSAQGRVTPPVVGG